MDNLLGGPLSYPLVYGDVVVVHPEGTAYLQAAAELIGAAAAGARASMISRGTRCL